jgi:DUF2924 family protein
MEINLSSQVARLPCFSRQQLLSPWEKMYGRAAPPGMGRSFLVPFHAYRLQERAFGGLKLSIRAELRRIARALEKGPGSAKPDLRPRIKPVTRIIREWQGKSRSVCHRARI